MSGTPGTLGIPGPLGMLGVFVMSEQSPSEAPLDVEATVVEEACELWAM